jgi:hypothetical protein
MSLPSQVALKLRQRENTFGVAIMVLTFLIGYGASRLFVTQPSLQIAASPRYGVISIRPKPMAKSRRISIREISFCVPESMEVTGPPGNEGVIEALRGFDPSFVYVNYAYGKRIPSDLNPLTGEQTELTIDGHAAVLSTWKPIDSPVRIRLGDGLYRMQLVVPNVGKNGNKFELYVASYEQNLLTQILDTVHIEE